MIDTRDLRIDRVIEPIGGGVRTDSSVPFRYITNVGDVVYRMSASNLAVPATRGRDGVWGELPDASPPVLDLEFDTSAHPHVTHVTVWTVPPVAPITAAHAEEPLIIEALPVIALDEFVAPQRRGDPFVTSVVREVYLDVLPDHYRISWERESPTTIFDCGPVRFGSVGATIVCVDIRRAGLELTDEFDRRIAEGLDGVLRGASNEAPGSGTRSRVRP